MKFQNPNFLAPRRRARQAGARSLSQTGVGRDGAGWGWGGGPKKKRLIETPSMFVGQYSAYVGLPQNLKDLREGAPARLDVEESREVGVQLLR